MPNLALVDIQIMNEDGQTMSESYRYTWTDQSFYCFIGPTHKVTKSHLAKRASCLPKILSLYFLFGITVDQAKSDHDWEIVSEDDSKVILIALAKNRGKKTGWFKSFDVTRVDSFYVTLDKKNYRTKAVVLLPEGSVDYRKNGTIYLVTDYQINPILDLETMRNPPIGDFELIDDKPPGPAPKILKQVEDALNQKK